MNPLKISFIAIAMAISTTSHALYPDLTGGSGACNFENPFAGTNDCVQYTGGDWTDATAQTDCETLFSAASFVGTYTPGATCAIADHAVDCVEDAGGALEKVNQNSASDPSECSTLIGVCASILEGDYYGITGSVCDVQGPPPTSCELAGFEPEVCEALDDNADVDVEDTSESKLYASFTPITAVRAPSSFVLVPGANVPYQAYAPLAQEMAKNGYYVAILNGPNSTIIADVEADVNNSGVQNWILAGHSLGGVTAIKHIVNNPNSYDGLGLLASFPDVIDDISGLNLSVVSIYGTNDLIATPVEVLSAAPLLPSDTVFANVKGGNHAQFGYYGDQNGDGNADISSAKQLELTAASLRHLAARVEGTGPTATVFPYYSIFGDMTNIAGSWWTLFTAAGYSPNELTYRNTAIVRTVTLSEFVGTQTFTTPGSSPEMHLAQHVEQTGNPSDTLLPPIIDGQINTKFITQERIETELGIMTDAPQGSCADVNKYAMDKAYLFLSTADRAKVDTWTILYQDDVPFSTGPDFIIDSTAVFSVSFVDSIKYALLKSPTFFASMDASNGDAAGRHYCKTIGYERAYHTLRHMASQTP